MVNKFFIGKKDNLKLFRFKDAEIQMDFRIKNSFSAAKTKRYDEILKFSFKFVRRGILNQFQKKYNLENLNGKEIKNQFIEIILENKNELIDNFFAYEVSTKNLKKINSVLRLRQIIKTYIKNDFTNDFLEEIAQNDYQKLFSNSFFIFNFFEMMFSVQQKKKIMLEDLFCSYKQLKKYFFNH